MSVIRNLREEATGVLALLVLGAGFVAMFFPTLSPVPFWVVWIVGFAVVLPLVDIALGETEHADETAIEAGSSEATTSDPLSELRRRYAEGEIDELEFERRLERLLETEDEGAATEYVERRRAAREGPSERSERGPSKANGEAVSGERHASRERAADTEEHELDGESA